MKKNDYKEFFCPLGKIKKWLFLMKLITFFLFLGLFHVSAATFAQRETVTFSLDRMTVDEVFSTIRKQLKYDIFYSNEELDATKVVQLSSKEMSVEAVLREILQGRYSFEFIEKTIVIRPVALQKEKRVTIQGVVKNTNGETLPGVSVLVKGTLVGVSTDTTGRFELGLTARENIVLIFSFVGMQTKEVVFKGESFLNVVLTEAKEELEEVVITGYQQIEKRQLTSAVSTVKTEDLKTIGATSIEQMLQGQLSGLSVVNTSAGPGASPKIRVRGTATIAGNADPLWVLDGVMLENSVPISVAELNSPDVMNMFNSAIGGINPTDIESITVLKDASATAIYGTRAANGVIVVTTKNGKRNGFNISYQHTSTVSLRPCYKDFNLLNSKERVRLSQQIYDEGLGNMGSVGLEHLLGLYASGNISKTELALRTKEVEEMNTDWFKLLFRNAYSQTHNLSISGGTDKTDYYVSLTYNGEDGVDKVSDYEQFGGLMKFNAEMFRGVKLGTTLQVGRRDRESYHASVDPFSYAVRTARTIPVYDEYGNRFFYSNSENRIGDFNILHELENTHKESTQTDIKAIVNLSVDLYKGLKYKGLYSYSSSNSSSIDYATEQSAYIAQVRGYGYGKGSLEEIEKSSLPFGGVYNETTYEQRTSLIRNSLEYKKMLFADFSIDAMIGQEFRTTKYKGLTTNGWGYMHDRGNIFYEPAEGVSTGGLKRNGVNSTIPKRSYISYYGVFSAMYKNRYVINGNVRFDGSNLFGSNPKYRYLPLWSVSGKWIVSGENFMKDIMIISNLAIRGSYGLQGNIVEESTPQLIASSLPPNEFNQLLEMEIVQAPNPDLKWETTSSLNIGLELGLFDDRLTLDVDYYRNYSRDLIASKNVSAVTGFLDKYVNYADVKNQGVDVSLSGMIIRKDDVSWFSSLNFGYVKNNVEKSYIKPQAQNLVKTLYTPGEVYEGKPVNAMFSYRFAGLNEDGMPLFYDVEGNKLDSSNPDIAIEVYSNVDNLKYEGTRDPVFFGGFNNVVQYRNLTFSALFSFGLKNVVRLPDVAFASKPAADENVNRSILDRWMNPGDEVTKRIPRLSKGEGLFSIGGSENVYSTQLFNQSTETVVPGDFLRLRNVMVEYRLPNRWIRKVVLGDRPLGAISLKFQAQNLFVLADKRLKGYDPETINYRTTGYGSLPLQTTFTLGLNVNF